MTTAHPNSAEKEARDRNTLADLIDRGREDIIARWMDRIERELGRSLSTVQLRDAMPDYLRCLADALRRGEPLQDRGASAWQGVAREHALTRVRLGFDISELVHEFVVLRQVLSEVGRERQIALDLAQAERVADFIEAAISTAVRSYVEARDYAARQKEAEHVAFMTHELRNPLSAVKLAANRLLKAGLQQNLAESVAMIARNVNRLEALVDRVLNVQRLEAGKVQPQVVELELDELLGRLLSSAAMAAQAKGITLNADYDPHVLVRADRELAQSAISNVVDNAIKYTDVGEVRVVAEPEADLVFVHVWDNCPGLSHEELSVIFEPFERGHSKKPGSGLGLAIARRALEAQGGCIEAESGGERGCHFWLALPRAKH